ncbi:MAG: adenylate/guanylate cyclase domain-containing protein [Flavobacteriales bacterium]
MAAGLKGLIMYFIPVEHQHDPEELRCHRLMVSLAFITALYAISYIPICILIEYHVAITSIAVTFIVCVILPFLLRRGFPLVWVGNAYLLMLTASITKLWISTGGIIGSANDPGFATLFPIIALLLMGRRWAIAWLLISIGVMLVLGILDIRGQYFPMGMAAEWVSTFTLISLLGHVVLLYVVVNLFENTKNVALQQLKVTNAALASEQQKTERLLLNILPAEVAEELKASGTAEAREFDQVTILFSDFKNFTSISEHMSPKELVEELNACFMEFDRIVESLGVEKIKTIGDAYMAVAGLQAHGGRSAKEVVLAGLQMQTFLQERKAQRTVLGAPAFDMRIGIHTGSVVAGIVGVKKFQYDIWGDAVNTAARMEQNGEVGRVNVSQHTYALLKDDPTFAFTPRGTVEVKGKGGLEMFFAALSS